MQFKSKNTRISFTFTKEELEESIRKAGNKKAPGSDGIAMECVKILAKEYPEVLLRVYNNEFVVGNFPSKWKEARLVLIRKPTKSEADEQSARRIYCNINNGCEAIQKIGGHYHDPKKGEVESPIEGEGKVEKIGDLESKITTNGSIHNEIEYADKEENEKDDEVVKENGVPDPENSKTPEAEVTIGESLSESTDPNEKSLESLEKSEEVVENNKKNKDKSKKKKWSFRSISFSRKDKSKPSKDSEKNGEVKEINEETAEETTATPVTPEAGKVENETTLATPADAPLTNGDASPKTDDVPEEAPKPSEAPVEPPKVEEPVAVETPKEVIEPKVEEPKPEEPKIEETKAVEPKVEEKKIEEPKHEEEIKNEVAIEEKVESHPVAVEESKEVRNEEVPPPLPSSNPPSPVTVFAESTMADTVPTQVPITEPTLPIVEPVSETPSKDSITQEVLPLSPALEMGDAKCSIEPTSLITESSPVQSIATNLSEPLVEPSVESVPLPIVESTLESAPSDACVDPPVATDSSISISESVPVPSSPPKQEPVPEVPSPTKKELSDSEALPIEPVLYAVDQVINADSLPDISTESLPSLPEPSSESLPEPMSLPPVDCVPEPIAPESDTLPEPIPNIPLESEKVQESVADIPLPPSEVVLTNGDAHGPPSPVVSESTISSQEAPIKQVVSASETSATESTEERHESGDKPEIVEAAPIAATTEE